MSIVEGRHPEGWAQIQHCQDCYIARHFSCTLKLLRIIWFFYSISKPVLKLRKVIKLEEDLCHNSPPTKKHTDTQQTFKHLSKVFIQDFRKVDLKIKLHWHFPVAWGGGGEQEWTLRRPTLTKNIKDLEAVTQQADALASSLTSSYIRRPFVSLQCQLIDILKLPQVLNSS